MKRPKFTSLQLERVKKLESSLESAANFLDFKKARDAIRDIVSFLSETGHYARMYENYNLYCECLIDLRKYKLAEEILRSTLDKTSDSTKVNLTACILLAISCLRQNKRMEAKQLILQSLKNEKVIKSFKSRQEYHLSILKRYEEEAILGSAIVNINELVNDDNVYNGAVRIIQSGANEKEIFELIGTAAPSSVKEAIKMIDGVARNAIPGPTILLLPSPQDKVKNEKVGMSLFSAFKRALYAAFCDPKSELYKTWNSVLFDHVCTKTTIIAAAIAILKDYNLATQVLAVPVIAMLLKFPITVFCEKYRPFYISTL